MTKDRTNKQIKLTDGRMLGYDEYGAPEGKPVFFFHGFPGSRLDWTVFDKDDSAAELKARIIAVDRPGMGLSDFERGRKILDWPDDVSELADALQLNRFAVLGISGGGPYACACAFKIPQHLTGTAIVCGMGPAEAPGAKDGSSWALPRAPSLIRRLILRFVIRRGIQKNLDSFVSSAIGSMPEPDKVLLQSQPGLLRVLLGSSWMEAFKSGVGGTNHEASLYTCPWQFQLQEIIAEVHLWHGEQDKNVLVSVGRYVADAIPNCRAKFIENEGHFSLPYKFVPEILSVLVA